MFSLLSGALTASTSSLTSATTAVPQLFDSIETARDGAAQIATSLDSTSDVSAVLSQVSTSTAGWSAALAQARTVSTMSSSLRSSLREARLQLSKASSPADYSVTLTQIDELLKEADGFSSLGSASSLDATLSSLASAAARGSAGLTSARTAARRLRDGLAELARARPGVEAAVAKLTAGATQLGVALKSIDAQLAVVQKELRSRSVPPRTTHVLAAAESSTDTDAGDRMAYTLLVGGVAAAVAYAAGAYAVHRRRPVVVHAPAPLANLTRVLEMPARAHGAHSDPSPTGGVHVSSKFPTFTIDFAAPTDGEPEPVAVTGPLNVITGPIPAPSNT